MHAEHRILAKLAKYCVQPVASVVLCVVGYSASTNSKRLFKDLQLDDILLEDLDLVVGCLVRYLHITFNLATCGKPLHGY